MCRTCCAVLLLLTVGGLASSSTCRASAAEPVPHCDSDLANSRTRDPIALTQRSKLLCGRNSLYILLRLQGHAVTYDQVEETVPVGPHGTSMLQLRDAADRLGLKTTIRKCSLSELRECPMPVIAHYKMSPYVGSTSAESSGHFVVVTFVDPDRIEVLDGSFGRSTTYRVERFEACWSGHILAPARSLSGSWEFPVTLAGIGLPAVLGFQWWRRTRAQRAGMAVNETNGPTGANA